MTVSAHVKPAIIVGDIKRLWFYRIWPGVDGLFHFIDVENITSWPVYRHVAHQIEAQIRQRTACWYLARQEEVLKRRAYVLQLLMPLFLLDYATQTATDFHRVACPGAPSDVWGCVHRPLLCSGQIPLSLRDE